MLHWINFGIEAIHIGIKGRTELGVSATDGEFRHPCAPISWHEQGMDGVDVLGLVPSVPIVCQPWISGSLAMWRA